MERDDVTLLAQLVHSMEDSVNAMEKALKKGDFEGLEKAKKEVLDLQSKIDVKL